MPHKRQFVMGPEACRDCGSRELLGWAPWWVGLCLLQPGTTQADMEKLGKRSKLVMRGLNYES